MELNVKFHREELTKELFVEYRVISTLIRARSLRSPASSECKSIWICLKKLMFLDNNFNYCYYRFEITESSTCHQKHSLNLKYARASESCERS